MKKTIAVIIVIALSIGGYLYRSDIKKIISEKFSQGESESQKIPRNQAAKKVDSFDIENERINFSLSKTGLAHSSSKITITPQISGKIISSNFKIGDHVKRGQTLFTIGDSLNTELLKIQSGSTTENYELSKQLLSLVNENGDYTTFNAELGSEIAKNNLLELRNTERSTNELFQNQLELAKINLENADIAYENSKESYDDLLDNLDDVENNEELTSEEREAQIKQLETQIEGAKSAKKISKNAVEQAETAIDQLRTGNEQTLEQLETTGANSQLQYRIAINQFESANIGNQIQVLKLFGFLNYLSLNNPIQ